MSLKVWIECPTCGHRVFATSYPETCQILTCPSRVSKDSEDEDILELEIAITDGMKVELKGDKVVIVIDRNVTKRDLWEAQLQMWLTSKKGLTSSGYLRVIRDKLNFKLWKS